ncbi:putative amino acid/polyamine transporter I [Helianthus debilis subsp. tardiflorus]
MMLDNHIGSASIARSLASYIINIFDLSSYPQSRIIFQIMLDMAVTIVLVVIIIGAFEVDVSNWSPFARNGSKSMLTGATVALFACVGFDLVANLAEECKRPQTITGMVPYKLLVGLLVCVVLYIGVCLVITGMVPYKLPGEDAPLAEAFKSKGLNFVSVLISIGAIAGLTTTLLVGLYVQCGLACILGLEEMGYYLQYLLKFIQHDTLQFTLKSGLELLCVCWLY